MVVNRGNKASWQRDSDAVQRDLAADARDDDSDRRDDDASGRDDDAERRDRLARQRDSDAIHRRTVRSARSAGARASGRSQAVVDGLVADAAADSESANQDRDTAARDRKHAALDRWVSSADRLIASSQRGRSQQDRRTSQDDRAAAALDRADAAFGGMNHVYPRAAGLTELCREVARAHRMHQPLALICLDLASPAVRKRADVDRGMAQVTTTLRAHLRPYDVIVRLASHEVLCVIAGSHVETVERRIELIDADLAQAFSSESVNAGAAELKGDDTPDQLLARAQAAASGR